MNLRAGAGQGVNGANSVRRALAVLRLVGSAGADGIRLNEVSRALGLNVSTAHRLLSVLTEERFLDVLRDGRSYALGAELLRLGQRAEAQDMMIARFRDVLAEVAQKTQDTVFLSVRRDMDALCLAALSGPYHIRTMALGVGSVRPLGSGAGSLALLAFQPPGAFEAIVKANAARYPEFRMSETQVREMAARAREAGYALNDGQMLENVYGVGVPVYAGAPGDDGEAGPIAAVSVAAIEPRMRPARQREIVDIIRIALEAGQVA